MWFMRLPTGEVELTADGDLERAFRAGLVDARTPVRAVGSNMWTTLGEAAELSLADTVPISPEPPASDLESGARWHIRRGSDPEPAAFLGSLQGRSSVGALVIAVAMGLATLGFGVAHADMSDAAALAAPLDPIVRMDSRLVRKLRDERETREVPHHSARDLALLTKEQMRHMRALDLARRLRGDAKRDDRNRVAGKPIVVPYASTGVDPFAPPPRNPFDF